MATEKIEISKLITNNFQYTAAKKFFVTQIQNLLLSESIEVKLAVKLSRELGGKVARKRNAP